MKSAELRAHANRRFVGGRVAGDRLRMQMTTGGNAVEEVELKKRFVTISSCGESVRRAE